MKTSGYVGKFFASATRRIDKFWRVKRRVGDWQSVFYSPSLTSFGYDAVQVKMKISCLHLGCTRLSLSSCIVCVCVCVCVCVLCACVLCVRVLCACVYVSSVQANLYVCVCSRARDYLCVCALVHVCVCECADCS